MGCSNSTKKMDLGCLPIVRPCNSHVLLQISTKNQASQCYCNSNGCNMPAYEFKRFVGGYLILLVGTLGIIGNCLAFGVLYKTSHKKDIEILILGNLPSPYPCTSLIDNSNIDHYITIPVCLSTFLWECTHVTLQCSLS